MGYELEEFITNGGLAERIDGFKKLVEQQLTQINNRLDEGNEHFKQINGSTVRHSKAIVKIATRLDTHSFLLKSFIVAGLGAVATYLAKQFI